MFAEALKRAEVAEGAADPARATRWGEDDAPADLREAEGRLREQAAELEHLRARLGRTEAERDEALAAGRPALAGTALAGAALAVPAPEPALAPEKRGAEEEKDAKRLRTNKPG